MEMAAVQSRILKYAHPKVFKKSFVFNKMLELPELILSGCVNISALSSDRVKSLDEN